MLATVSGALPSSKVIAVTDRTQFLMVRGLEFLLPGWLSAWGHSRLLEVAVIVLV